jgi:orotate phosphoribosyltransferase
MALAISIRNFVNSPYFIVFMAITAVIGLVADFLQLSTIPHLLEFIVVILLVLLALAGLFQMLSRIKGYFDNQFGSIRGKSSKVEIVGSIEYEVAKRSLVGKLKEEDLLTRQQKGIECNLAKISLKADSPRLLGMFLAAVLSHIPEATKIAFLAGSPSHFVCTTFKDMLTEHNPNLSLVMISGSNAGPYSVQDIPFTPEDDVIAVVDQVGDGSDAIRIADAITDKGGYISRVIALYDEQCGALERLRKGRMRLTCVLTKTEVERFYE